MRAVLFITMAASLLVHATFGSCLHHGCDSSTCHDSALTLESDAHCDHDCCNGPKGHESHAPDKGHSHCRGTCNYLPAKNPQLGKCQLSVPVDFAWGASAADSLQTTSLRFSELRNEFAPRPPLRLHLLNQILLI